MTLTYTSYVEQLSNLMVIPSTDANFTTFLPGCIDYAEQRIYRELDLLVSRVTSTAASFSSGVRTFSPSTTSGTFIVIETINAISSGGTRYQMVPVTKEFIDAVYPGTSSSVLGRPQYFAPVSNTSFLIAPAPDSAYSAEVIGVIRPTPLSASNSSTFLTANYPDLFIAASMVFATGYQRDFGAETDDPKMPGSWESQYQALLASAMQESMRAKYEGSAWTPKVPVQGPPPRA